MEELEEPEQPVLPTALQAHPFPPVLKRVVHTIHQHGVIKEALLYTWKEQRLNLKVTVMLIDQCKDV